MAKFNISIAAEIVIPYTPRNQNNTVESCNTEILTYNMTMYDNDPESYSDSVVYFLNSYTGDAWKTLTIDNITYSHFPDLYLEYLGVAMEINTTYNIDVSSLSPGVNIPDLFVKADVTAGDLTYKNISYNISITDINDASWDYVVSSMGITLVSCSTPVEPFADDVTSVATPPTEVIEFTVTTAPFASINFQYRVDDKSTGGFAGQVQRLDSAHGAYVSTLTSISNSVGTTFNVIDNAGATGIMYYRFPLTTFPPNPAGPESDSFTNVTLFLRNNANSSTIQSFNIWIGETTAP